MGKRVSRSNSPDEWKRSEDPHLAVVNRELFARVQERKASRSHDRPEPQRKVRYLLSGLLKCGCCSGGLAVKDRDHGRLRLQCSVMREPGTGANRRSFYMDAIEKLVLDGLQKHLTAPHLLKVFAEKYFAERKRLSRIYLSASTPLHSNSARGTFVNYNRCSPKASHRISGKLRK